MELYKNKVYKMSFLKIIVFTMEKTCRLDRNAAKIMGNMEMFKKMEITSNSIKRDILIARSLYLAGKFNQLNKYLN